ncbi:MAG: 30S ribosome-binding factor RbfA [Deltaproteobacteria bacterium]|nr:30S ribosome-binding factor RbfA [Candidatus Anaeroferrophillus wilburensis]MBN2888922.1 30S ribosome-binding factor RbfA [Deltaproteobacteria bacterium]
MRNQTVRCRRVADSLKKEISCMLLQEVKDPRISLVTILDVAVSPDLSFAQVYYTLHGSDVDKRKTQEGLQSTAGFLRRELGRRLRLKRIPELHFRYDDTVDRGFELEQLLDRL